ncbi:interleukin-4 receptor subunit alpha [Monodelphis domestica]|uniref:Interleukin 4 receptor n=1 Tax=Monodelphis domestica TaxID=13616 RepID=K7E6C0_MONDO|nr:interleukin-4 receptor subunit alpha [Monodelphis domestica]
MGQPLPAPVCAWWWCLFLWWARCPTWAEFLNSSVNCYSDYDSFFGCEWKTNRPTNCSSEFQLYYNQTNSHLSGNCTAENKRANEVTLPLECVCQNKVSDFAIADMYQLKIQTGKQVLWEKHDFIPFQSVKPRTPTDLVISEAPNDALILTWNSTYSSENTYMNNYFIYEVEIFEKDHMPPVKKWEVFKKPNLTIFAYQLKNKCFHTARVKSKVFDSYTGPWSDWSQTIKWYNEYPEKSLGPLELGVPIFCILILFVNILCYFSVIKIKKVWWDQIPNPAHSHLTAIIIQDSQLSSWRKLHKAKEKKSFPHWKICLSKVFPCLLSHNLTGKEESPHSAKDSHFPLPSKREGWPVEVYRAVLMPEQISVVQSMELYEPEVESEKGDDDDDISFIPSPENSASSFIQNKEALAARFAQTLFFDLIGEETFMSCSNQPSEKYKDLANATESPLKESKDLSQSWANPTGPGSPIFQNGFPSDPHISETVCQSPCQDATSSKIRQPPEPHQEQQQFPSATQMQSTGLALVLEVPQIVADNTGYRSFNSLLAQSMPRTEEELSPPLGLSNWSSEEMAPCCEEPDLQHEMNCSEDSKTSPAHDGEPSSLLQPEEESWEEILRQRVLRQEGAVTCPTILATSGYQCFDNAVKQGNDQNYEAASFNVPKESGYRSFASLLNDTREKTSAETFGDKSESGKGEGGYQPLENLNSSSQETEKGTLLPLFTFGMDLGEEALPQKCQHGPMPSNLLKMYSPNNTSEEEIEKCPLTSDREGTTKHKDTPEGSPSCAKLDFNNSIVYSTLTCHLCGHLKRCQSSGGNYMPLGDAQRTECNCVVENLVILPQPLLKANSSFPLEQMESLESGVPRTSSVEPLGESHSKEESSLGVCVSLLSQDWEDPCGSNPEKCKGITHLKPNPSQSFSPSMADCEHEGNTYMKIS